MILHILIDDKFSDYVISQFSDTDKFSKLVIMSSGAPLQHIHQMDAAEVIIYNSPEYKALLASLSDYSAVLFHGLFWSRCAEFMDAIPENVKIAWMFWGGEIYSRKDVFYKLLGPITRCVNWIHDTIKKRRRFDGELPIEYLKRIDYCLTDITEEYIYAKNYLQSERLKNIWYTYYSLEDTIGSSLINARCSGNGVWFCNSAAIENSMYDALWRMRLPKFKKQLKDIQIVMPLSYGEMWVKGQMLKIGPRLFGDRFRPLVDYLPREEYNKLMLSCSTLILPYYSPAGQGNIITGLWLGMRVYLSKYSMSYTLFKRYGAIVFTFEDDFPKYGTQMLTDDEVAQNRAVLKKWYSKEHILSAVNDVVRELK